MEFLCNQTRFHAFADVDSQWAEEQIVKPLLNGQKLVLLANDRPGGDWSGLCDAMFRSAAMDIAKSLGHRPTTGLTRERLERAVRLSADAKQAAQMVGVTVQGFRRACRIADVPLVWRGGEGTGQGKAWRAKGVDQIRPVDNRSELVLRCGQDQTTAEEPRSRDDLP